MPLWVEQYPLGLDKACAPEPDQKLRHHPFAVSWTLPHSQSKPAQKKVLTTLRGLLHHVGSLNNKPSAAGANDTRQWREYVMAQYRAGALVKDRSKAKQLRTMATDILAGVKAVAEQKVWYTALHGMCLGNKWWVCVWCWRRLWSLDCCLGTQYYLSSSSIQFPCGRCLPYQDLFYRYGGLAQESPQCRKAAATRVGVTIPEKVPLREFDHSHYHRQ